MKTIVLIIVTLLCWQYGYSQEKCNIRKKKNMFILRVEASSHFFQDVCIEELIFADACLKVVVPADIKVTLRHIQQIYRAYASPISTDGQMMIQPNVVDKNGIGLYSICVENGTIAVGCVLYNGKQMVLPIVPMETSLYTSRIPEDIYRARLEVVKKFLEKHNDFTEEQKERIMRSFGRGTIGEPPKPYYF